MLFEHFKDVVHCFLPETKFNQKIRDYSYHFLPYVVHCFARKLLSYLLVVFSRSNIMIFFLFILLRFSQTSWICKFVAFITFWKTLVVDSAIFNWLPFSRIPFIHVLNWLLFCHRSLRLFISITHFFLSSVWIGSIMMFSSSQIFYLAV